MGKDIKADNFMEDTMGVVALYTLMGNKDELKEEGLIRFILSLMQAVPSFMVVELNVEEIKLEELLLE